MTPHPDAELLAACAQHPENMRAYNAAPAPDDEALWPVYEQTRDVISAAEPQTMAGILAKVRAAKVEATRLNGEEDPHGTMAERWAWEAVHDVLRLYGTDGADPDAALHDLRRESAEIQRRYAAGVTDEESAIIGQRKWDLSWQAADTPAHTPAGLRSKAAVALDLMLGGYAGVDRVVYPDTQHDLQITIAVLREIVEGTLSLPFSLSDDSHLIAECDLFHAQDAFITAYQYDYTDEWLDSEMAKRDVIENRIKAQRPVTNAGRAAKARIAMILLDEGFLEERSECVNFAYAVLQDLAGGECAA